VEFAARCGVNVCEMAYQDALGLPVTQAAKSYRIGEGCVDLHRDIGAVWNQDAGARGSLWKILSQWKRAHYHSFRLDDPRPGLYAARGVLLERLRRPK